MHTTRRSAATATGGLLLASTMLFAVPASAQGDLNCSDFDTQAEAQAEFDTDTSDPNGLDRDDDNLACESLPGGSMEGMAAPEPGADPIEDDAAGGQDAQDDGESDQMVMPEGGAATGGGGTAGIENAGLLAAGGLALAAGVGGLLLSRRRFDSR